ncbi:ribonuclease E activity regulator RraA [Jatrophihabitans sp. YIM 134969]
MTGTSDLYDAHAGEVQVLEVDLRSYGGRTAFDGAIVTVACSTDNSRLRELVATPGTGKVLVVDGGGSTRHALLGDMLGAAAVEHGWAGVVLNGAVRDVVALAGLDLGVLALGSTPRRGERRGEGRTGDTVSFGNVTFRPGANLYADADGVLVADRPLAAGD